ncbi:MAG: hypothetical protein ACREAA_07815 [Candidatus Polarisedimenticolia bacterium]
MNTKFVMFSLALSVLLIAGQARSPLQGQAATPAGRPAEPAADLNASVVLEAMTEAGSNVTGRIRVNLTSLSSDTSVTLSSSEGERLAHLVLRKGEQGVLRLPVDLRAGEDNDLGFWVEARRADGSVQRQRMNLMVPLAPERQPEVVGDSLQYQGSVDPDGGRR